MKNVYFENENFGKCSLFNTETGKLNKISEKEFEILSDNNEIGNVFINNSLTHTIFPRIIYFQITRKCNLSCPYCFISADQKGKQVPWEDIKVFAEYFRKNGLMEVRLTGGEPTLHSHFQEIVDVFLDKHIYVSVATNGCWSSEILEYFKRKKNIFLIISVDGPEYIQDTYRSNSYNNLIKNISELRKYNKEIRIRFNTVLTKENYLKLEGLFELADKFSIEYINFIPLKPQLRSANIKEKMLNATQYKEAVNLMVTLRKKYGIKFNTSILASETEEILKDNLYKKRKHCSAGTEGTNLDYDFDKRTYRMYGCAYSPAADLKWESNIKDYLVAGEFTIENVECFKDIWNNDACWKIFRQKIKPLECRQCERYGKGCVGACVIQNLDYKKLETSENAQEELYEQIQNMREHYCKYS